MPVQHKEKTSIILSAASAESRTWLQPLHLESSSSIQSSFVSDCSWPTTTLWEGEGFKIFEKPIRRWFSGCARGLLPGITATTASLDELPGTCCYGLQNAPTAWDTMIQNSLLLALRWHPTRKLIDLGRWGVRTSGHAGIHENKTSKMEANHELSISLTGYFAPKIALSGCYINDIQGFYCWIRRWHRRPTMWEHTFRGLILSLRWI